MIDTELTRETATPDVLFVGMLSAGAALMIPLAMTLVAVFIVTRTDAAVRG